MSINVWNALWAGAVGAGVMLVMMYASRLLGLVRADFPRYQGCIITRQEKGAGTLLAGLTFTPVRRFRAKLRGYDDYRVSDGAPGLRRPGRTAVRCVLKATNQQTEKDHA